MNETDFLLVRDTFQKATADKEGYTLGTLSLGDLVIGMTCEDEDRHLEDDGKAKVYGKSAIPRGRYRITVTYSHRFQKELPEIQGVPGFSGIRIHGGNTAEDSHGCVLVGKQRTRDGVAQCGGIVQRIMSLINQTEDKGRACWIKIM